MPFAQIYLVEGRTEEQKAAVMDTRLQLTGGPLTGIGEGSGKPGTTA